MKKRTFLWFDLTPRWKMWKRIEELESEVGKALAERETAYQDLASMNQKFLALTHDLDSMQKRVLELEGKLQKFNRTRGKSGKYVKSYDTRSKAGGKLTVRKAERLYHTTELRRIISRLRKMGYSICSNRQKAVTEDGRPTQFNEYYMPQVADSCQ